jgi:dihydropteroate synthase
MKSAAESNVFSRNYSLNIRGRLMDLRIPKVMGILNITEDSFYAGSRVGSDEEVLRQAARMLGEGADILDVGGMSTRPGAGEISEADEISRVRRAVSAIKKQFPDAVISCDTYRSEVARVAVGEGASIINDVTGGEGDKKMFGVVSQLHVPYILMHMRGTPETMATLNQYENLTLEIIYWLQEKLRQLMEYGAKDVIVDPGFGFAKSPLQGFELLKQLEMFQILERPVLVGISRKSMIWKTLGITPEDALNGTTVLHSIALMKGASVLRVHDVREAVEAIKLMRAYESAKPL